MKNKGKPKKISERSQKTSLKNQLLKKKKRIEVKKLLFIF